MILCPLNVFISYLKTFGINDFRETKNIAFNDVVCASADAGKRGVSCGREETHASSAGRV